MGQHSNRKGKRGERELCNEVLRPLGVAAIRSQQNSGVSWDNDSADVLSSLPAIRIEVKRGYNDAELYHREVQNWIQTARDETPEDQQWLIAWRRDRRQWQFIFPVSTPDGADFAALSGDVRQVLNYILDVDNFEDILIETHY